MNYILILYIVLSLVMAIGLIWSTRSATTLNIGFVILVNVLAGFIGLYRIRKVKDVTQVGINRKGIIGAQHSWIMISINTAVLVLLFGSYFKDSTVTTVFGYIFLTIISLIAAYAIIEVAIKKLPFLD